jgi:hypothetical protein
MKQKEKDTNNNDIREAQAFESWSQSWLFLRKGRPHEKTAFQDDGCMDAYDR